MYFCSSCYHKKTYNPRSLKARVNHVVKKLKELHKKVKFDAIAFRGMSGAAIAYPVSMLAGYHLIAVRTELRRDHGKQVEGSSNRNIRRYIILDDFVATGATVRKIVRAIDAEGCNGCNAPQCVGIAVFDSESGSSLRHVIIDKEKIPIFTL